ncbi:hypothetical protein GCM10027440_47120 [Nocardiopsis coralliicola]
MACVPGAGGVVVEGPVDNFMDAVLLYCADDAWMSGFTQGRADRMADHWHAFRARGAL